jgi:LysM repeat protein
MKLPQLLSRKKLRAMTARRALGGADMDYEEMSEPNMKLSRALLIVLVLHVVAVAGIVAFNTIKARQGPPPPVSSESLKVKNLPATSPKTEGEPIVALPRDESKTAKPPPKQVAKDDRKIERAKPVEDTLSKPAGSKTYVVAKGDSPASIARKFKVPYDDIMAANRIEDPHKLKVGQKLIIPKSSKPKKADQ